jgi:heme a synthase
MTSGRVGLDDFQAVGSPWPHWLAVMTAGATFLLILVGGIVTNTESGMAVPDWPTTFGYNMFTYPVSKMIGGVLYEHSHRLIGSLVGAFVLTLAAVLWRLDRRPWVRWLGIAALGAVIVQGILGGLRVVLVAEELAIVHGAFAQAFFALVATIALVTSPGWRAPVETNPTEQMRRLRRLALITTVALYVQVMLGTLVTHLGAWADAHVGLAMLVSVAVVLLGFRILPGRADWPELVLPVGILRILWIVQLILGLGAYLAKFHPVLAPMGPGLGLVFPLLHRLVGALMLICCLILALRAYRRSGWVDTAPDRDPLSQRVPA